MLIIVPDFLYFISFITIRIPFITPNTLTSTIFFHSDWSCYSILPSNITPALLTIKSVLPYTSLASLTAFLKVSASDTSIFLQSVFASFISCIFSTLLANNNKREPSLENYFAKAIPNPELAPVITTNFCLTISVSVYFDPLFS